MLYFGNEEVNHDSVKFSSSYFISKKVMKFNLKNLKFISDPSVTNLKAFFKSLVIGYTHDGAILIHFQRFE